MPIWSTSFTKRGKHAQQNCMVACLHHCVRIIPSLVHFHRTAAPTACWIGSFVPLLKLQPVTWLMHVSRRSDGIWADSESVLHGCLQNIYSRPLERKQTTVVHLIALPLRCHLALSSSHSRVVLWQCATARKRGRKAQESREPEGRRHKQKIKE